MIKVILISILFITSLISKTFNFSETRYSDALGSSIKLHGKISFETNSISIKYNDSSKSILYKDSTLILKDSSEIIEIEEQESRKVSQYFELLLLLNSNDNKLLTQEFEIFIDKNITSLTPKQNMKHFIEKIVLIKEKNKLKELKLFLTNKDKIIIRIEDEIF